MPSEEPAGGSAGERDDGADTSRIREIEATLRQRYGRPDKHRRPPLDELVLTILSQNTNDTNRDRAWEELRTRFGSWREVLDAKRDELEDAIRVAGLAGQKSKAIHGVLPVLPVDTHVRRVSERLGLIPEGTGAIEAYRVLKATVPPELRFPLHLLLIGHGRATCGARRPACGECVLGNHCPRVGVA